MQVTPAAIRALDKGFNQIFQSAYDETRNWGQDLATTVPSSHKSEVYGFMKRLLAMREWVGPRVIDNLESESYTLVNKTFEKTVGVMVNDIEDETLGVYNPLMGELGRLQKKWPDQQLKSVLQAGTSGLGFDGQAFFSSTHDLDPAGNQSNNFTSSALTPTNYEAVRVAMMSHTGEDGEPLGVMPNKLFVPPQLEREGLEILKAVTIEGSSSNSKENVLRGTAELVVIPELANEATTWYLADCTGAMKPLIWQLRQSPSLVAKNGPQDDNVFHDDQVLWGSKARGAAGYGPWWLMARATA